jgi:hypothetical protein
MTAGLDARLDDLPAQLGIHDFGRVLGQRGATLLILLGDHVEDMTQLRQNLFPRGHQGVTAGDGGTSATHEPSSCR